MTKEMISTTEINYITTINEIFTVNKISFRKIDFKNGVLYLCTTPFGRTFNLGLKNNQSIKIWSFIGITSIDRAGNKYEWENENTSYPVGGIEITGEGDLSFYMEDVLIFDKNVDRCKIANLITIYINMIPHILSRSFEL